MYVLAEILFLPRLSVRFGAGSGQVISSTFGLETTLRTIRKAEITFALIVL